MEGNEVMLDDWQLQPYMYVLSFNIHPVWGVKYYVHEGNINIWFSLRTIPFCINYLVEQTIEGRRPIGWSNFNVRCDVLNSVLAEPLYVDVVVLGQKT